jgi:hypothetical protein
LYEDGRRADLPYGRPAMNFVSIRRCGAALCYIRLKGLDPRSARLH